MKVNRAWQNSLFTIVRQTAGVSASLCWLPWPLGPTGCYNSPRRMLHTLHRLCLNWEPQGQVSISFVVSSRQARPPPLGELHRANRQQSYHGHLELLHCSSDYGTAQYQGISLTVWYPLQGFPGDSVVKNLPGNARDTGLIPGLGRYPGGGRGSSHQYSCLESPKDRGTW